MVILSNTLLEESVLFIDGFHSRNVCLSQWNNVSVSVPTGMDRSQLCDAHQSLYLVTLPEQRTMHNVGQSVHLHLPDGIQWDTLR